MRIGILTGGGDVQPLNALIKAARDASLKFSIELVGFKKGWQGILDGDFISLSHVTIDDTIGGTLLRSSRVNIKKIFQGASIIRNNLELMKIDGIIVVGGEDTLSNSFELLDYPQVLISKTIDNDVGILGKSNETIQLSDFNNYFTLGHPTAARKIASFISLQEGVRTTAYSHERIIVVESMGMHAGWLALSSCMGKPDFIVVPEFPLPYDLLIQKIADRYKKYKHVVIVVAEGARWEDGSYIRADTDERDDFGHPRFNGAAEVLVKRLKRDLKSILDTRNVNSINPSYLYRSGSPCEIDKKYARLLGEKAVHILMKCISEPVLLTLQRGKNKIFIEPMKIRDLNSIDDIHRFLDERLYDVEKFGPTKEALLYWRTISKEYPEVNQTI